METSIQKLVNQGIQEERALEIHEPSGKYYPSAFGMCYRAQYLNRKNIPRSNAPDERVLRVFKSGKLFEDFVTNLIVKEYPDSLLNVLCEEEDIKGFADLVRPNEVSEIKSQHSKAFWYMSKYKNITEVREGKYHNFMQAAYYAKMLDKEFIRLVYISKDDLCIKEYVDKYEGYWQQEIEKELRVLRLIWEEDRLPAAVPRRWKRKDDSYAECGYCDYKDYCYEIENAKPKRRKINLNIE